jgi:outer membrane protein assembly factor BamE (lipoprotein component of BamABCDE complex)
MHGIERISGALAHRRLLRGVVLAAVLAGLAGCASIRDHRGYLADTALVESVQPGVDNKTSVERSLGRPTFVSEYGQPAWYYVSVDTKQAPFGRPKAYNQMVLRVAFDPAGNVVAVDRRGVEKVVSLSPDGDKTATAGRDRSFIEDLFGNIGSVGAPGMGGAGGGTGG